MLASLWIPLVAFPGRPAWYISCSELAQGTGVEAAVGDGEGNLGCETEGWKGRHLLPCAALPGLGRDQATVC